MRTKPFLLTFSVLLTVFLNSAYAEDKITIVSNPFPPQTVKKGEREIGGIAGEIVSAALKNKNISYEIVWLPWKRAQNDTIENINKNTFIIPLTRNKERENEYVWVAHLYHQEAAIFTLKGKSTINSFTEAKGKNIGVLMGTSFEISLKAAGVDPKTANVDEANIKKLEADRIDGWYIDILGGFAAIDDAKLAREKFEYGKVIEVDDNWIATGKNTPKELVNKVRMAIEEFSKSPEFKKITSRYTGK